MATVVLPKIRNVEFINNCIMFVHFDNDRTIIVPLDKFPTIKSLTTEQQKGFEIIDDTKLSFLGIDEIFTVNDLIGI